MGTRFFQRRFLGGVAGLGFLLVTVAYAVNPVPSVVGPVNPQAVAPGHGDFSLAVYGANFVQGAMVNWNRQARSTTFVSARELHARILASDVAQPTAGYITVTNPAPGGGSSGSYSLVEVHTSTATLVPGQPRIYSKSLPEPLITSDFNNDGVLDFAAAFSFEINVMLGNGDGTFRHRSFATRNYVETGAIASGDFNGDGNADLVFAADPKGPPFQLEVRLGNGDGTFRGGSRFGHFPIVYSSDLVVGDFNDDGKLDVVSIQPADQTLLLFLGNGNGTFQHAKNYPPPDNGAPVELVAGDFNGDGKLDLVVESFNGQRLGLLSLFVGNGDGTFQKPRKITGVSPGSCGFGHTLQVSDFNGDGILDVAYCDPTTNVVRIGVLLGNGDGTFQKPVYYSVGPPLTLGGFAAGDFNSDGKTDLLVSHFVNPKGELLLFLGTGDGTFQKEKVIKPPRGYFGEEGVVPGDFNSDGLLDFMLQLPGEVAVYTQR
jgi:hypothetical protein